MPSKQSICTDWWQVVVMNTYHLYPFLLHLEKVEAGQQRQYVIQQGWAGKKTMSQDRTQYKAL